MKYYYLHLLSCFDLDEITSIDHSEYPPIIANIGLEIDWWPVDDLVECFFCHIVVDSLKKLLQNELFNALVFYKIDRVARGCNFLYNYPNATLPQYWHLEIQGTSGIDDFGLWEGKYLVVSEKALDFLRVNNVTNAESDLIEGNIDEYFRSDRKDFWL